MKKEYQISNSILVKEYSNNELESFIDVFTDEELCKYMAGGAFKKRIDAENLFKHLLKINDLDSDTKSYGIFSKNILIGHLEIMKNSFTKNNELEIVYLLRKEYWGKAIMKSIIEEINKYYTENFIARVKINNYNSIKMLSKIGIKQQTITTFNNEKVFKIIIKK